jgi:hypothetical protein
VRSLAMLLAASFMARGLLAQTTVTLSTSMNAAVYGQPVTLTATVTPAGGGKVTFYDGAMILGIGSVQHSR